MLEFVDDYDCEIDIVDDVNYSEQDYDIHEGMRVWDMSNKIFEEEEKQLPRVVRCADIEFGVLEEEEECVEEEEELGEIVCIDCVQHAVATEETTNPNIEDILKKINKLSRDLGVPSNLIQQLYFLKDDEFKNNSILEEWAT